MNSPTLVSFKIILANLNCLPLYTSYNKLVKSYQKIMMGFILNCIKSIESLGSINILTLSNLPTHEHDIYSPCLLFFNILRSEYRFYMYFLCFFPLWFYQNTIHMPSYCSVAQSCLPLCDHMDCRTPGSSVFHYLPEFVQTPVHRVGDAIQPSHPLLSPSPPDFNLSHHQGLSQ